MYKEARYYGTIRCGTFSTHQPDDKRNEIIISSFLRYCMGGKKYDEVQSYNERGRPKKEICIHLFKEKMKYNNTFIIRFNDLIITWVDFAQCLFPLVTLRRSSYFDS